MWVLATSNDDDFLYKRQGKKRKVKVRYDEVNVISGSTHYTLASTSIVTCGLDSCLPGSCTSKWSSATWHVTWKRYILHISTKVRKIKVTIYLKTFIFWSILTESSFNFIRTVAFLLGWDHEWVLVLMTHSNNPTIRSISSFSIVEAGVRWSTLLVNLINWCCWVNHYTSVRNMIYLIQWSTIIIPYSFILSIQTLLIIWDHLHAWTTVKLWMKNHI